jgi:molybdopterin molybdotransferase
MAQLSDDCFAHGGAMMPLDEALAQLSERLGPIGDSEFIPVARAAGRILAADVTALSDVPPHDNSAVDGYAVFFEDLDRESETRLPVTGRVPAGGTLGRPAKPGEAIRIFTGAPMPDGPDTVMMQEDCREEDGAVAIAPGISKGANLRRRGEDVRGGETILHAGHRMTPQDIGLAATAGHESVEVFRPLRVAVFSTGDEVRDPGVDLPEGGIYDANRHMLIAALTGLGCAVDDLGILPDDRDTITAALASAAGVHDLILTSGGVSTGDEDHVKAAVEANGNLHFWRLAIKPGRPIAMGQVGATPIVGLPGNPGAVLVTFLLIARPIVLLLSGAKFSRPARFRVRAVFDHKKKGGRREFVRARLEAGEDGEPVVRKFGASGAGILSALVGADGLVDLPEDLTYLESGSTVDFLPFSEVQT